MTAWIIAGVSLAAGLVAASLLSPLVRRFLQRQSQPEAVREVAPALASFVFWALVAAGLLGAVSTASPESLSPLPGKLIAYFPKALVAGMLLIAGHVLASIAGLAVARAVFQATGRPQPAVVRTTKAVIKATTALLAVGQLGIDTTIVNLAVAALLFGGALAMALLVGFGGRDMARQVAAGRYLRRLLRPGDALQVGELTGVVVAVHAATIEIELPRGERAHVPHGAALESVVRITRPEQGQGSAPHNPQPAPEVQGTAEGGA